MARGHDRTKWQRGRCGLIARFAISAFVISYRVQPTLRSIPVKMRSDAELTGSQRYCLPMPAPRACQFRHYQRQSGYDLRECRMAAYRQWALMFSTVKAQTSAWSAKLGRFMPVSPIRRVLLYRTRAGEQGQTSVAGLPARLHTRTFYLYLNKNRRRASTMLWFERWPTCPT